MLRIGWSTRSITPDRPAMLQGQMHVRVARKAMDPLVVNAMAIEGGSPGSPRDAAVLLTYDLGMTNDALMAGVRRRVSDRLPSLPGDKIIFPATHTHTSLVFEDGFYPHPGGDVMPTRECEALLIERGAEAAIEAWQNLAPARIGRAYGHAVVAHNRRPAYADGASRMYGPANDPAFRWIEGSEDHSLDMLFVWNEKGALAGILLDIPCPSQVDEGLEVYSADFWHEIRLDLRRRLGAGLHIQPLCGPAGDQSPHFIVYGKQEEEMRQRRGLTERQEIAQRVGAEVERALACTKPAEGDTALAHSVRRLSLTPRKISRADRDWSLAERERSLKHMDPKLWWPTRLQQVADIFDGKVPPPPVNIELHALRIGDAVLATNPFELFVDYGLQIKARSPAGQTFLAQIACGTGWYLPSERAARGGSYGAIPAVSIAGPEAGQELVEATLQEIGKVFGADKGR